MSRRDLTKRSAGRLYSALPVWGQTLAVNAFGVRNLLRKAAWNRYLASIEFTERLPREKQVELVADRLRSILSHAVRTVPRYREHSHLLRDIEHPDSDVFALLTEFPIVERSDVVDDPEAFQSEEPGTGDIVKTITSGTTGSPFTTRMSIDTFTKTDALWWRRNIWSGYRSGDWIARLVGDPIVPISDSSPRKPWRVSWVDRRIYFSTFHLNRDAAMTYVDVLEQRRPDFIMGYPSSLEILSSFCADEGRTLDWTPKAVWFSSEPMLDHQRAIVSRVFGAPIRGLYGCAERLISASQCDSEGYHLSLVDGFAEGQFGILPASDPALLTSLMNRVMPFVRYRLGDVLTFKPSTTCPCGRTLPLIEPVITKLQDWLETPTGRRISPSAVSWNFQDLPGVRRSQVAQVDDGTIVVRIDADDEAVAAVSDTIRERLEKLFFGEMDIEIIRTQDIDMMESGKAKFVVRENR